MTVPATLDETLTRGGPVVMHPGYDFISSSISTDQRRTTVVSWRTDFAKGAHDRFGTLRFNPQVAVKPAANVFISVSPSFRRDDDPAQYVQTGRRG